MNVLIEKPNGTLVQMPQAKWGYCRLRPRYSQWRELLYGTPQAAVGMTVLVEKPNGRFVRMPYAKWEHCRNHPLYSSWQRVRHRAGPGEEHAGAITQPQKHAHFQGWIFQDDHWYRDPESAHQTSDGWTADPPKRQAENGEIDFTLAYEAPIDVVVPLSRGSVWQDNELRYALRSVERNLAGLRRVYIVGHRPDWLRSIIHLPADDLDRNKDANIIEKILLACEQPELSQRFLFLSDDQVLLEPCWPADFGPFYAGDARALGGRSRSRWRRRLLRTGQQLAAAGLPSANYDLHVPTVMEREMARAVFAQWEDCIKDGMCVCTLYHNAAGGTSCSLGNTRARFETPRYDAVAIQQALRGRRFLQYNDRGLTPAFRQVLADLFPEKSSFEA